MGQHSSRSGLWISTLGYSLLWPPTSNFLTFGLGLSVIPVQRTGVAFFSPPGVLVDIRWKMSVLQFTISWYSWHFCNPILFTQEKKTRGHSAKSASNRQLCTMPSFPVAQCDWTRFFLLTWLQAFEYGVPNLYYLDLQTIKFTFLPVQSTPRYSKCWSHETHMCTCALLSTCADQLMKQWFSPTCPLSITLIKLILLPQVHLVLIFPPPQSPCKVPLAMYLCTPIGCSEYKWMRANWLVELG